MQIKKFEFSVFVENTYLLWDENSRECWVIDPGCCDAAEEERLSEFISANKLVVTKLINTHCHLDHIFGCQFVKEKYNAEYLVPEKDLALLQAADKQAQAFGIDIKTPPAPDGFIDENSKLSLNGTDARILFTPGHTPGEVCLYFPTEKTCITGDVLFNEGIGRTDLWGGSYPQLIASIKNRLFTLPDDTVILPGHGPESTIGNEKKFNPFLQE